MALTAGLAAGIASAAVHQRWWALVVAAVATLLTLYAAPPGWDTRFAYTIGWVGIVGFVTLGRPEGDYLVAADAQGYALLGLALVVLVLGVSTLPRPDRRRDVPPTDGT